MRGSRIRVLPEHLANQIAAGEVVRRPASVVKELIENALDAGADDLLIVIEDGGKNSIRVADNGEGMREKDAILSIERHATSKIERVEDLEAISTYGFRGEALPSIAAVSHLSICTREAGEEMAVTIRCSGGNVEDVSRAVRDVGTTVDVRDLFYNVPGRRKFLRSRTTEFRHLYDVVQRVALCRPELRLKCISNDKVIFDLRPATLALRMEEVFGANEMEGAIPVNESNDQISVVGYLGKPGFSRKRRGQQLLFLNRRPVQSRSLNHAVFSAYEHLLTKSSYPFFLLLLEIDPRTVDVNVHPAKLEVKLEDEQAVYRFLHHLTRKALAASGGIPSVSVEQGQGHEDVLLRFPESRRRWFPPAGGRSIAGNDVASSLLVGREEIRPGSKPRGNEAEQDADIPTEADNVLPGRGVVPEMGDAPVWQIHRKYIVVQIEGGLLLVDQHVAHERILYERILDRFETGKGSGQQLLFPVTIELTAADELLLTDLLPSLRKIGFVIRPFGKGAFLMESAPPELKEGSEAEIIRRILWSYREHEKEPGLESHEVLAQSYSCRAAIKAGDPLQEAEMRALVQELFKARMPLVCPHGRPTVLRLSLDELDRRFGRK